ncbi:MAG: metallophosphoesterase [Planctomycetota bacterium]
MSARHPLAQACLGVLACLCAGFAGCNASSDTTTAVYVQDVTPTSAVVAAITAQPTAVVVEAKAADGTAVEVEELDATPVHGFQLRGLRPSTDYTYTVHTPDGLPVGEGSFHTAPAESTGRCVFLVTGDSGGTDDDDGDVIQAAEQVSDDLRGTADDENREGDVVGVMLRHPADLVLHLGDVVYPAGAREDYAEGFYRPFAPLIQDVPIYPTLGNHDVKTEGGAPYLETFFLPRNGPGADERVYSFDWGPVHFVALDVMSQAFTADSEQGRWLEEDLARTTRAWTVVYFHVPPYSAYREGSQAIREALVPLLEAHRVDLVLSGHDHLYARFFPHGSTTYVVSGGGGKNLYRTQDAEGLVYAESVFHFLEVTAEPGKLWLRAIDASDNVFDELVLEKPQ